MSGHVGALKNMQTQFRVKNVQLDVQPTRLMSEAPGLGH